MHSYYSNFLNDNNLTIFLFHGVISKNKSQVRNYNNKHISLAYFQNILSSLIQSGGCAISLDDFKEIQKNNSKLPKRSFCITFDDGFKNNLEYAAPVLVKYNIPTMFYITSSFIDQNKMSWVDRIEWAFDVTKKKYIDLPWRKGSYFNNSDDIIKLLEEIRENVKDGQNFDQDEFANLIQSLLAVPLVDQLDGELDEKLNWGDVKLLCSEKLFKVGAHTHNHKILSKLKPDDLAFEIKTPLSKLSENCKYITHHFSYPEGKKNCFNDKVIEVLKESGITICPTAIEGVNKISQDLFHLKRINVI